MAGSRTSNKRTSMEDIVNTSGVHSSSHDGITSYKVGSGFEFGKVKNSMRILRNLCGLLFSVQFGKNTTNNSFAMKSNDGGVWNNMGSNVLGSSIQSNQLIEYIQIESSTQHSSVNDFVVINIPEEYVEPKKIILNPDDQPMWESAKTVAPTPNSAIIQFDVNDNFVINSTT
nr:hypothetical protein [Tanacetum cinerariifolium]